MIARGLMRAIQGLVRGGVLPLPLALRATCYECPIGDGSLRISAIEVFTLGEK